MIVVECIGQTYNDASNMVEKILALRNKSQTSNFTLSIAVKSLTSNCNVFRDTLGTVGEICVPIKFSPKREKILEKIAENIAGALGRELERCQLE